MLRICCPVQRGTRVAATMHTSSSANSFIQRDLPPFAFGAFGGFAGEGVVSAAAPVSAAAAPFRAAAGDDEYAVASMLAASASRAYGASVE